MPKRVLIVESVGAARTAMRTALLRLGEYSISEAGNYSDARTELFNSNVPFDIISVGMTLPLLPSIDPQDTTTGEFGADLVMLIKQQQWGHVRQILLYSRIPDEHVESMFLRKGFSEKDLPAILHQKDVLNHRAWAHKVHNLLQQPVTS